MNMTASDETLSRYHGRLPLDEAVIRQLKDALLQPSSAELRIFLESAIDTGKDWLSTDQMALMRKIVEHSPHLFCSEAIERATITKSLVGRLYLKPMWDPELQLIHRICSLCKHGYRDFAPGFSAADTDRVLRARTLATEDIAATIEFHEVARYLDSALDIESIWDGDPRRLRLYQSLIERLERAEAATRQNEARMADANAAPREVRGTALSAAREAERYFREDDYALLEALRRVTGSREGSGAAAARAERDSAIEEQRARLFDRVSPIWRELFAWLLDLPYTADQQKKTLQTEPRLTALVGLSEVERGAILSDLAGLRIAYPDWVNGRPLPSLDRLDGLARTSPRSGIDDTPFHVWIKLGVVASLLIPHRVRVDDEAMAKIITTAQGWRELCDFGLFSSAELTLASGPAPRTVAALRALAIRPSHAIMPGSAGPEYEGDIWWNGAPKRALDLVARYDRPSPAKALLRLFGRRGR